MAATPAPSGQDVMGFIPKAKSGGHLEGITQITMGLFLWDPPPTLRWSRQSCWYFHLHMQVPSHPQPLLTGWSKWSPDPGQAHQFLSLPGVWREGRLQGEAFIRLSWVT